MKYWFGLFGLLGFACYVGIWRKSPAQGLGLRASTEPFDAFEMGHSISKGAGSSPTEEQFLSWEVAELDSEEPDWYEPNLIAGARRLLAEGREFGKVASVYGERVTKEAERRLKAA